MSNVPYDATITENLQTVAEFILMNNQSQWTPWVTFLLTELESNTKAGEYTEFLTELSAVIASRLETGSW